MVRRHWPLALALAILWLTIGALCAASLAATDGNIVYPLDDPYIHLAMAKNLAQRGVLGVTRHGFTSTSSSPLWTLLLTLLFVLFGVRDEIPLLLNLALATGVVVLTYRIVGACASSPLVTGLILAAVIFATPLPALVVSGTEHVLQTLACLAFAWVVARRADALPTAAGAGTLYALGLLAAAVRYEDLFLVATAAMLLAARRRLRDALVLIALACVPGTLYGLYSAAHGWAWLPNSLLAKGAFPGDVDSLRALGTYCSRWVVQLAAAPPVLGALVMASVAALATVRQRRRAAIAGAARSPGPTLALLFGGTALLHLQFASVGSFYRYEAYLIALSVLATGICVADILAARQANRSPRPPRPFAVRAAAIAVGLLMLLPLGRRALASLANSHRASRNIYQQQVQVGRFLQRFYEGQPVAINDIGAINYLADVRSLDLWGLADREIGAARRAGRYTTEDIRSFARAHGVVIAVVYEAAFVRDRSLPGEWNKVAEWEIPDNFICGWPTVSFWAVDPAAAPRLQQSLAAFTGELPRGVAVRMPSQRGAARIAPLDDLIELPAGAR